MEVFDTRTRQTVHCWKRAKACWCVRFSADGAMLAAAGYCCTVSLYDMRRGSEGLLYTCSPRDGRGELTIGFLWTVVFSASCERLAFGSWNGEVKVWQLPSKWEGLKAVETDAAGYHLDLPLVG